MKQLVVLGSIILGTCASFLALQSDQIVSFFVAGYIPFTDLSLPPLAMLLFWILLVPVCIGLYQTFSASIWKTVEMLGKISQRHINRQIRWGMERHTLPQLLATVLIYIAESLPESSSLVPELVFRRRFLALPT